MTDMTNQTDPIDPTPTPAPAPTPKRSRRRSLLIGGGAVLASVVLIGGGLAVGAAIADENDDEGDTTSDSSQTDDGANETDDDGANEADEQGDADDTTGAGAASADELLEIIETASAEGEGQPIGIESTGTDTWEVAFVTSAGDESEVLVDAEGKAVVVSTESADPDDQVPDGSLDAATLESLVKAALAHTDGTVVDIELDSDAASPYDVTVLTAAGKTVDIALGSDFAVVTAGSDDD